MLLNLSLSRIVPAAIKYKYWAIFPIAVIEGPIISILTGFLASLGYLSLPIGFIVVTLGDLVGDSLYYGLGRFGRERFVKKYGSYLGLNWDRVETLEKYFERNPNWIFVFGKFAHGTGSIMWIATGIAKVPFLKFLSINAITTMIKTMILIYIGYYFGKAYNTYNYYLSRISIIVLICFIVAYIIALKTNLLDKIWKRIEE